MAAAKLAQACPSLILSSPYRRARQSAKVAADLLGYMGPVLTSDALTPDADSRAVWEEVRVHQSESGLLLAGHEPLFSSCTAYLLGCSKMQVDFPKRWVIVGFRKNPPNPLQE